MKKTNNNCDQFVKEMKNFTLSEEFKSVQEMICDCSTRLSKSSATFVFIQHIRSASVLIMI